MEDLIGKSVDKITEKKSVEKPLPFGATRDGVHPDYPYKNKYYEPTEQDRLNNCVYQSPDCWKVKQSYRDNFDSIFGKQDIFKNLAKE